jgi:hypothetical protein
MPPQEDGGLAICFFIVKVNDSGKPVVTNRLDLKVLTHLARALRGVVTTS